MALKKQNKTWFAAFANFISVKYSHDGGLEARSHVTTSSQNDKSSSKRLSLAQLSPAHHWISPVSSLQRQSSSKQERQCLCVQGREEKWRCNSFLKRPGFWLPSCTLFLEAHATSDRLCIFDLDFYFFSFTK